MNTGSSITYFGVFINPPVSAARRRMDGEIVDDRVAQTRDGEGRRHDVGLHHD